jgi:hypothetical protein
MAVKRRTYYRFKIGCIFLGRREVPVSRDSLLGKVNIIFNGGIMHNELNY